MNEIEFLPKRFREKQRRSTIKAPRLLIFSLLISLLAIVSLVELARLYQVRSQLANLKVQHKRIDLLAQQVEQTRAEVAQKRHYARLQTFLEYPYPRSQILAVLLNPLPGDITIKRIELTHSQVVGNSTRQKSEKGNGQVPPGDPMQIDLAQLIDENKTRQCTVELEGTTDNTSLLYTFLATLHESKLIESAKIESIDPQLDSDGREFSNFTAHVQIRRGHFRDFYTTIVQALPTVPGEGGVR
ncbi:hypothetical protein DTL42_19895 [Bremerella cremea]|uniref:Uncharacterized protein n=1 Tax=Bremerella cremea TaxID=1031537 RepID=A0A368KLU2_9BACT|nr:hypothetical protein [Bremerella cremea]RCS42094.1 hypothetical protein DTL42_19895 [Bremerella cremea]